MIQLEQVLDFVDGVDCCGDGLLTGTRWYPLLPVGGFLTQARTIP